SYPAGSSSTLSTLDPRAAPTARGSFFWQDLSRFATMVDVIDKDEIRRALEVVIDPELHRSIVELDMVRSIDVSANGVVDVTVSLTTPGCPIKGHFQTSVAQAVSALDGVTHVNVYFDVLSDEQKANLQQKLGRGSLPAGALAQVANVLCIGSGKGGVGKSTLTANLAAALTAEGKRVGVLDADVWGYSIPRMYGLGATRPPVSAQRKIIPLESHGVKVMSIGFFVEEDAAVVWRGPMLHKALTQFLQDVEWGALDYLLVDLPPGTGDVSMTLAQLLPQAQFMIVTTPQATAQKVARRSAHMAHKVDLQIGGVIENMSSFTTPSGERFTIFGEGGGQELADELDVPLLGKVPLTMPLREQADSGVPLVIEDPDDPAAQAIRHIARGLIAMTPDAPFELPVLPLVEVTPAGNGAPTPTESAKPVGMSLPMA
ncbi:MAG: Mrp/NBP35 family ATP-binding protein, partial [Solirubrobacterales bacterium]|nr:Mrp/NBP35 family ATP-binding protein [Solirubrobacterales bacterium]